MKRAIIVISICLITLIVGYYPVKFIYAFIQSHSLLQTKYKEHLWLVKDSVKKDFNKFCSYSLSKDRDIWSHFIYKKNYYITVWEFKDLGLLNLQEVSVNFNKPLNTLTSDGNGETFAGGNPEVQVRYGYKLGSKLSINLDKDSRVIKRIVSSNYSGFYGVINRMGFESGENENFALFDYPKGPMNTLLILYKKNGSLYVLILESKRPIDESWISIFNLN